jgi:hypothetical protein
MSPKRLARILWLLPAIFIVHDTDELLTIPGWLALHRLNLERMAERNALAASLVHTLATTTPQVAVGIGFLLIVFVAVTAAASASLRRGPALYIYASLLVLLCYKREQIEIELFCGKENLRARPTRETLCGIHERPGQSRGTC